MLIRPLDSKVILIVGGTSGIGLSAVRACAAAGAHIAALGLNADAARASLPPEILLIESDATQPDVADRAIEAAVDRFGSLHGLYHVAGGSGRRWGDGPLHDLTDEGFQHTLSLNLASVAWSNRAAIRRFLRQKTGGAILNLSSVLAHAPSVRFATHAYAAAKGGIISMTRAAAAFYARDNIRLNVLCPGLVDTPMARRAMNDPPTLKYVRRKQPLDGGRPGAPADLDAAAVYFLSDESRFATGQVLTIDGGWSISESE